MILLNLSSFCHPWEISLAAFQARNLVLGTHSLLYFSAALLEAHVFAKRFHSVLGVVLGQPISFLLLMLPHGSADVEFCAGG